MNKKVLKQLTIIVSILFISVWSISYLIQSEYLSKTNSKIDYSLEKLADLNEDIVKVIQTLTIYSIYNYDHLNEAIQTQEKHLESLQTTDLLTTNNYPKTKEKLMIFENSQNQFYEQVDIFLRLNAKVKNSYNYLISSIGEFEFTNKKQKKQVAQALRQLILIKNSMDLNYFIDISEEITFLSEGSTKERLFKTHIDLIITYMPQYIKIVEQLLENNVASSLLTDIETSFHTESAHLIDEHIEEFYGIIVFTFLILLLLAYYINMVEKDKNKIINLQKAYSESIIKDELTDLKNRAAYMQEVAKLEGVTILQLNIVDFSSINTLYGQYCGDIVLQKVGKFLKALTTDGIRVYRYSSDKFIVVFNRDSMQTCLSQAKNIIESLEKKAFTLEALEQPISINVIGGLSNMKPYVVTSDYAMKSIKNSFDRKVALFDESMMDSQKIKENISIIKQLKHALNNDALFPLFQPILDLKTGKVAKYEALIRMQVNDKLISPFFFLELSKKAKLYTQITHIVLQKSIEAIRQKNIEVSINLSIEDINHKKTNEYIKTLLLQNKDIAHKITFELLETEEITNFTLLKEFIYTVKEYGCHLAIDDFGSGFSNYGYLMDLDVDIIKIDASLIKNIHKNENSKKIVNSIVHFAHDVGIEVVAEFVSSEEIETVVKELNINYGQGFLYSEPIFLESINS